MEKATLAINMSPTYDSVRQAARALHGVICRTPVLTSPDIDRITGAKVFFKCENLQHTGSFKLRGGYNALQNLSAAQRSQGVVTFSSGNHAQAVACAAQLLTIPAIIIMPKDAPHVKIKATMAYGATIRFYDRTREDRRLIAAEISESSGMTLIPPFDHPDVIAGQGTAAKELFEETGPLDALFVCVGGGGLLAGSALSASALAPECKVIGVEPEAGNDAQQSLEQGRIVRIPVPETIADGARTEYIGDLAFPILQRHVEKIVTVTDEQLLAQMRFCFERLKLVTEPTGCLAAAAVLSGQHHRPGQRIGVLISGGNVEAELFQKVLRTSHATD